VTEEKYDVSRCVEEAAIIVTNNEEPRVMCTITLTSPIMRETADGGNIHSRTINTQLGDTSPHVLANLWKIQLACRVALESVTFCL